MIPNLCLFFTFKHRYIARLQQCSQLIWSKYYSQYGQSWHIQHQLQQSKICSFVWG